jgi:hypothetical protein
MLCENDWRCAKKKKQEREQNVYTVNVLTGDIEVLQKIERRCPTCTLAPNKEL